MPTPLPDQDAARTLVRERISELALSVKATERLAGLSGGSLHGFLKASEPEGISATTMFALLRALGLRLTAARGRPPATHSATSKKPARTR